jgi:uncharacterized protein involved in exopolysaccharide biosynthesis
MRLNDLFENDSLKDYFKQLQKTNPKFSNIRIQGDPEHDKLRQQDQVRYQARQTQAADAAAAAVDVNALKQQLASKQAEYKQLGGDSYQYADRMMPRDFEAQRVHQQINILAKRIQAAGG